MKIRKTLAVTALMILMCGCEEHEPSVPAQKPAVAVETVATKPGAFSRAQLIEDARQLSNILEDTHPDPYINGGGRIAFHRRLHQVLNAIPDEGMTKDEFYRLVRPFVAGVGDAHTNLLGGYDVDSQRPSGIPLRFRVVEQSLVVSGVCDPERQDLLGHRLVSVEGVLVEELLERQRQLRGIDNVYHALQNLADQSLRYRPYLLDLVPEWKGTRIVRVELRSPDGNTKELELSQPASECRWIAPKSRVELPVPGDSGFLYAFLRAPGSSKEFVYLRFAHMVGYREAQEGRHPIRTKLARPPSATETFRTMVKEMKKRGTEILVVDVRDNSGGNSLIVDILVYFLYGKDALRAVHGFGGGESGVFRYSDLFFKDRPDQSLEKLNAGRRVPLVVGDYEFSWSFAGGEPIAKRAEPPAEPPGFQFLRASPTFAPEFESGTDGGYYHPRKVIVLCDAGTLSAGFSVVATFHSLGAILVGTPSAQAPNSYGAATVFRLTHTGIRGMVPMIAAMHFPHDPAKAHVLPVDYPLTYERLASYGFDPQAEYLYAIELMSASR